MTSVQPNDAPITPATERPLVEPEQQIVAPDPLEQTRPLSACQPSDADDTSDAGKPTTDHKATGWRAEPLAKP